MKVVNEFDQHNKEWLRAILKEDTLVAQLSNRLSLPGHQLYEVHLLPQDEDAITPRFLEAACVNSLEQLLNFYQFEKTDMKMHVVGIEIRLVSDFATGLAPSDARFHYSVVETNTGPVISVVFGSYRAMALMYDERLRARLRQQLEDECSD